MFANPYRGYQAVGVERGGGSEWGERRMGGRVGGVFGWDVFAGREADAFLDEDHLEGLGPLRSPYGGGEL